MIYRYQMEIIMGKYIVKGGNKSSGKVKLSSAKNAVMPMLAASILTDEQVVIRNCPRISDVYNMMEILKSIGCEASFDGDDLIVCSRNLSSHVVPKEFSVKLRSSIFILGPLISRLKKAKISFPGGCDIGSRPIDYHLNFLRACGCVVEEERDEVLCKVNTIKPCLFRLPFASVGATETAILTSVLTIGKTVVKNCAREPEIVDLVKFLNTMGACIKGAGTSEIIIEGVSKLKGIVYTPITDRIECGTFLFSTLITGGEIEIGPICCENIYSVVDKFCNNACNLRVKNDIIHMKSFQVKKACSFTTGPYPMFPTDLQPQAMVYNCLAKGSSKIYETVFENRFRHVPELNKMGANILVSGNCATIYGVNEFNSANVYAKDLRGGAALVLAGLKCTSECVIHNAHYVLRGYEDFHLKLQSLGYDVKLLD